jgi:tetratricopeptide (TPR) repeat protein
MVFLLLWIAASLLAGTTAAAFNLSRTPVADRYLYTPAAGWCLVLGALIAGRSRAVPRAKLDHDPVSVRLAAGWLLVLIFAGLTVARSPIYADDFAFWSAATMADPAAGSAQINLGGALWDRGDHEGAARAYGRALELPLAPEDRAMALTSLGALLNSSGHTEQAEKAFRDAASIPGADITATFNLGSFLYEKGTRIQQQNDRAGGRAALLEARTWLEKAAGQAPQDARAWLLLGRCYREEGRPEQARLAWSRVLQLEGEMGPMGKEAAASLRQIP